MSFRGNEVTVGISRKGKRSFRRPTAGYPCGRVFRVFVYDCFRFFRGGFLDFARNDISVRLVYNVISTGLRTIVRTRWINPIREKCFVCVYCAPPSPEGGRLWQFTLLRFGFEYGETGSGIPVICGQDGKVEVVLANVRLKIFRVCNDTAVGNRNGFAVFVTD